MKTAENRALSEAETQINDAGRMPKSEKTLEEAMKTAIVDIACDKSTKTTYDAFLAQTTKNDLENFTSIRKVRF